MRYCVVKIFRVECSNISIFAFYFFFSSRRRHTRFALVTEFRRVLFRSMSLDAEYNAAAGWKGARLDAVVSSMTPGMGSPYTAVDDEKKIGRASCRERVCTYV